MSNSWDNFFYIPIVLFVNGMVIHHTMEYYIFFIEVGEKCHHYL